jgi:hypothetical protein
MWGNFREMLNQPQVREFWPGLTQINQLNVGEAERLGSLLGGGLLALYGLCRRSPGAIGLALAGGYLIYRGLTGHCPLYAALQINTASPPRLRFDDEYNEQPETTIDMDDIGDEAVWQTFPASDPPSSW